MRILTQRKNIVLYCVLTGMICCFVQLSKIDVHSGSGIHMDGQFPGHVSAFSAQLHILYEKAQKISDTQIRVIFDEYTPVVEKHLDMKQVYAPAYKDIETLLNSAVDNRIDVLTLFTHPILLNQQNKAIVLNRSLLEQVDFHYNLHGLFLIAGENAKQGEGVHMNFLAAGQGKFIVGYDRRATISHPEYDFATGKYDYQKLFLMEAQKGFDGNYGLFNIRGLSDDSDGFTHMKGPLNSDIRSLSLLPESNGNREILVQYSFMGSNKKRIACIPIEKKER